jgi:hypothetical protein
VTAEALYPETLGLKTFVRQRGIGVRPYIELEPTDHPLAVEQREGITKERLGEIAAKVFRHNKEERLPNRAASALRRIWKRVVARE